MRVAIVGAGLLGRLLALRLLDLDCQIDLFDADDPAATMSCAYAAGGMLTPYAELDKAERIIFDLGIQSLPLWSSLIKKLPSPVGLDITGSLVVAHPQDQKDLRHFQKTILNKLDDLQPQLPILDAKAIEQLEPELDKPGLQGLYFPQEGQVDNRQLLLALTQALQNKITNWFSKTTIKQLSAHQVINADNEKSNYDWVFDCRGLGGKQYFPDLRGVRGELFYLHAPEVSLTRPVRLLHPRHAMYIAPRGKDIYLIGASCIEAEDFSLMSVRTTLEMLSSAYSLHSGFAEARLLETQVNCRPALNSNLPQIKHQQGLIAINGLYRHGFLISPALIEDVVQFVQQGIDALTYPNLWEEL